MPVSSIPPLSPAPSLSLLISTAVGGGAEDGLRFCCSSSSHHGIETEFFFFFCCSDWSSVNCWTCWCVCVCSCVCRPALCCLPLIVWGVGRHHEGGSPPARVWVSAPVQETAQHMWLLLRSGQRQVLHVQPSSDTLHWASVTGCILFDFKLQDKVLLHFPLVTVLWWTAPLPELWLLFMFNSTFRKESGD